MVAVVGVVSKKAAIVCLLLLAACRSTIPMNPNPKLQTEVERIDAALRLKHGIDADLTDVGVFDLKTGRLAMIHPDKIEYAASVAKVGILFAWFVKHPEAATKLDPQTQHELGQMIKASSNTMAAKFSREIGLREIQQILNENGFYDASNGGGIWVGKHYGPNSERIGDPVADHSHAVTVRQLIRFYALLDERKLISRDASEKMIEIFRSPDIPHDDNKFVKALSGRGVTILRKWGSYQDWLHDSAIVEGPGRRYILIGLTHHANGDAYLEDLARAVDDLLR